MDQRVKKAVLSKIGEAIGNAGEIGKIRQSLLDEKISSRMHSAFRVLDRRLLRYVEPEIRVRPPSLMERQSARSMASVQDWAGPTSC